MTADRIAMKVAGRAMRTIWLAADGRTVEIIDQTRLPHELVIARLVRLDDAARAIREMQVRGAPLIGATAAYGMALAVAEDPSDRGIEEAAATLAATRPTAVNLAWALTELRRALADVPRDRRAASALARAEAIAAEDVAINRALGEHGIGLIETAFREKGGPVQILTHCELGQHGVPHTVIADNAGGHLMCQGEVDLCITGTDRTTSGGDVANKIGTYLKALAAHDNGVPFYVALPSPTIDWELDDGALIPIEQRDPREVTHIAGWTADGKRVEVRLTPEDSPAANFAFDVTPARLVTGLLTERGVCPASRDGLLSLFPERRRRAA